MFQVKLVSSQKRLMTSFKLNIGQKLLKFWKVISKNLKIGNFPATLATSNFQKLLVNKYDSKLS